MQKLYFNPNKCDGCGGCKTACRERHSKYTENPNQNSVFIDVFRNKKDYWVTVCQNCAEAACIQACITGAMKYSESGEVIQDREQCVGCWMCVMVCPLGAVSASIAISKANKCNLCRGETIPACILACKQGAINFCSIEELMMI